MKAFLLAAGLGTRLRPLTDSMPKCLVPINGKPLLSYWLRLFAKHGVNEVLLNLHYLPEMILDFLSAFSHSILVRTFFEKELLGSAGTIAANKHWIENEDAFLIAYADNFTNLNLSELIKFHRKENPILTMALFTTNRPRECGIALLDENSNIIDFVEKPERPKSNLANAGIYVAGPEILKFMPDKYPADLGFDVLPRLVGEMKGFVVKDYILDIGNIDNYNKAQRDAVHLIFE